MSYDTPTKRSWKKETNKIIKKSNASLYMPDGDTINSNLDWNKIIKKANQ